MKSQRVIGLFTLVALLVAGCGAQPGKTYFSTGPGDPENMGVAPDSGRYAVYTATGLMPKSTFDVEKGQPMGFRRLENGHLDAVAGNNHVELGKLTAAAYWKKVNDR